MDHNIKYLSITPRSVLTTANHSRIIRKIDIKLPSIQTSINKASYFSPVKKPIKVQFIPLNLTPPRSYIVPSHSLLSNKIKKNLQKHSTKKSFFELSFPE